MKQRALLGPRILIVKLTSMGDVLFGLSTIGDIREKLPSASVGWVVDQDFVDMPRAIDGVDQVYSLPLRRLKRKFTFIDLMSTLRVLYQVHHERFDVVIDLQGMIKSSFVSLISRAPNKWSLPRERMAEPLLSFAFNHRFLSDSNVPVVQRYRNYVSEALGYTVNGRASYRFSYPSDVPTLRLQSAGRYIVFFPYSSKVGKNVSNSDCLYIIKEIQKRSTRVLVPSGSLRESLAAKHLADASGATLLERLSLQQLMILIADSAGFVGADTGLTHLAAALGKPTLTVFRTTNPCKLSPANWAQRAFTVRSGVDDLSCVLGEFCLNAIEQQT